jgi:hypothetical protein
MTFGRSKPGPVENARAFSVIEALISFVVLLVAISGLFAAAGVQGTGAGAYAFGNLNTNSHEVEATAAAQEYMDELRDFIRVTTLPVAPATYPPLPTAPTVGIDPTGQSYFAGGSTSNLGNFLLNHNNCPAVSGSLVFRSCIVTATWSEKGSTKSVSITSYATMQQ